MILQYRGFGNNWCYTDAETITFGYVEVEEITSKYRNRDTSLEETKELSDSVNGLIAETVGYAGGIDHISRKALCEISHLAVVTLHRSGNTGQTYALGDDVTAYLLNDKGRTIQKISG